MTGPRLEIYRHHTLPGLDLDEVEKLTATAVVPCLGKKGPHPAPLSGLEAVEINLVSDVVIAQVHDDFMGVPGATDVITFQHGEVFVSLDTAAARAVEFGHPAGREALLYIVHALLHLNGHEDKDPAEAAAMARCQEDVLGQLWPWSGL